MKKIDLCYLHIGTEKTGTTSIQKALADGRTTLLENHILYPVSLGERNHVKLALSCYKGNRRIDFFERVLAQSDMSLEDFRDSMVKEFHDELEMYELRQVVISNEHLSAVLNDSVSIEELFKFLNDYFLRIIVVVYLRRQDRLATSLHTTRILSGSSQFGDVFSLQGGGSRYEYAKLIKSYQDIFGKENIIIRRYQEGGLVQGDSLHDFLSVTSLDKYVAPVGLVNENASLSEKAQEFLAYFNKEIPKFIDGMPNPLYGDIQRLLRDSFSGPGFYPAISEAKAFYSIYSEGNEYIRSVYFPEDASLFNEDFTMYREKGANRLCVEDAMKITASIWSQLHFEMEEKLAAEKAEAKEVVVNESQLCKEDKRNMLKRVVDFIFRRNSDI
ncbi:hypothetical protein [Simiduia aestuariiviva]|uniref:Uncharacterized protein n=1 Tax=Simiduia aestuariiviva TaxID=1510459 RepID=A0A839UL38_9GAMM|nr:hypothetical protein [Simiduia aestuariiviva]MBB3168363.1 hypothetical protein [Simiduia aestuariiviva]